MNHDCHTGDILSRKKIASSKVKYWCYIGDILLRKKIATSVKGAHFLYCSQLSGHQDGEQWFDQTLIFFIIAKSLEVS